MAVNRLPAGKEEMTEIQHTLPFPVRLMNLAGRGADLLGFQPIKLGADSLIEKAQSNTGLSDFDGDEFREPLRLLVASLEGEAKLSLADAIALGLRFNLNVEIERYSPLIAKQQSEGGVVVDVWPSSASLDRETALSDSLWARRCRHPMASF